MLNFSAFKISFIALVCILAVFFCLPTIIGQKSEDITFLPDTRVNLGLDLRGGSYLLLEVNFEAYLKEQLDNLRSSIRSSFRGKKINGQRIKYSSGLNIVGDKITFALNDMSTAPEIIRIIRELSQDIVVSVNNSNIETGFDKVSIKQMKKNVLEQSIEIVRRRVDETGTREPDIQRQGDNRILLQVPGLENPEHLKSLLGKTAKLTFHLLNESLPYPDTTKGPVPPGTMRLPSENGQNNYAIKRKVMLSGDLLVDARPGMNSFGQPVVNLRFNNLGAKKFGDITKGNVGKPFAIVLDKKVLTAPVIRSVILGGTAEISGSFTTQQAQDLSLLLRAGALPAPLDIIEERTVGPNLGANSITAGKNAILIGIILVMIFMILSYGLFGLFSDIALLMNMIIIIAVISIFEATLTLPGIAGIVLTMGMAVDANVLIFERIKEEVRLGKTPFAAVDGGFKQAFRTIIDSNVTTLIAALLLYSFGSGPIKGFAVTLSVGILASMFSAILLTRLMVVTWLKKKRPNALPI